VRPPSSLIERALGGARRAVTSAAASLDRNVMRWTEERMRRAGEAARRSGAVAAAPPGQLREKALEIARAYGEGAGGLFFPAPERIGPAELTITELGQGVAGSRVCDLSFSSAYLPFWSGGRQAYLAYRENQVAHARWWRPAPATALSAREGGERTAIVLVHGWRAGAHWVSERVFEVAYWLRHGFDVVAFQLPLHGHRTPEGTDSGALFLTRNLARTNEAFGHAIYDLRALGAALRQDHGVEVLGALGMSLGGYTTALWASIPGELDFAVAMIPAVSLPELMMRGRADRSREQKDGVDEALLEDAFRVHSPLRRPVPLPPERLFVIAGHGDQITPPTQAQALIDHWKCPSHWFAGGHLAQVGRRPAMRAARRHLLAGGVGVPGVRQERKP
jgi:pimeloyl-ACP methyl ester carboxylesterase